MAPTKTDLRIVLLNDALVPPRITAIIHNGLQLLLPARPEGTETDADTRAIVANTTAPPEDQAAARELFHFAHDPSSYQLSEHAERLVGLKLVSQLETEDAPASNYVHLSPLARVVVLAALSLGEDGKLHLANPRKYPLQ
jgi:hypothetical protein